MRDFMLKLNVREFVALASLSIIAIPSLMVVFSLAVPALRNPLFLVISALIGFVVLRRFWLSRREAGP
jgi:hypothetical protein